MKNFDSLRVPKYVQLMIRLKEQIEEGKLKAGEPLPTRDKLMRENGLSLSTVTRAVTELERQGWLISRQGSGTFVCQRSPGQDEETEEAPTVALLLPVDRPKSQELVSELVCEAREHNINIVVMYSPNDEDMELNYARILLEKDAKALVWFPVEPKRHVSPASLFGKNQRPVIIGENVTHQLTGPWYCIRTDYHSGTKNALNHLLELGHRRIAYTGPKGNDFDFGPKVERWNAYRQTMKEMDLWKPDELYFPPSIFREWHLHAGRIAPIFQSQSAPTAIIGYDDTIALEAMRAMRSLGLEVPRDISVVGHGDFSSGHYSYPRLTTVSPSCSEYVDQVVRFLKRLIDTEEIEEQNEEQREIVVSQSLLVRKSTGNADKMIPAGNS